MSFNSADTPVDALSDWLMEQALSEPELEELVEGCNRRLHAAGIPVARSIITSPILHPLYRSFTVVWTLKGGIETTYHVHDSVNRDAWQASPLRYILMHRPARRGCSIWQYRRTTTPGVFRHRPGHERDGTAGIID